MITLVIEPIKEDIEIEVESVIQGGGTGDIIFIEADEVNHE